jgi:hypothetical protein
MNKKKGVYTKPVPLDQSLIKYYYQGFSSTEIKSIFLRARINDRHSNKDVVGTIIKIT